MPRPSRLRALLVSNPFVRLAKLLTRSVPRVLVYHRLTDRGEPNKTSREMFREQMRQLKSGYNVIALSELSAALIDGGELPPNAVVLTFDDGYSDFYEIGLPVLLELRLPATLYVPTDFIDGQAWLWPDRIRWTVENTRLLQARVVWGSERIAVSLNGRQQREAAWHRLADLALHLGSDERESFLRSIEASCEIAIPPSPPAPFRPLSWQQLRDMSGEGIEVGSHGVSHSRLSLDSPEHQEHEILASKRRIESELGRPVRHFCYPHGRREDFTETTRDLVISCGYQTAAVAFADADPVSDLFALRRYTIGQSMAEFRKNTSGITWLRDRWRRNGDAASRPTS